MSVKTTIRVDGLKELEQALRQLPKDLVGKNGGPVRAALMNAGLQMMRDMQAATPEDEGELKRTVRRKRVKNPSRGMAETVLVGAQGKRGPKRDDDGRTFLAPHWLEFGTVHISKRPFIRPAFDNNKEEAVRRFRKNLATAVERIGKKIGNENARKVGARVKKL